MNTRTLDLYALHPESIPPEYATAELIDRNGKLLKVGDRVRLDGMGECWIVGRRGAWIDLDQGGEPSVAFVMELRDGVAALG